MSKATKGLRRAGIGGLAAFVAAGTALVGVSTASATTDFSFTQVGGHDRYETAAKIAQATYTTNDNAILANGLPGHFADALSANYLAGLAKAPVLLTRMDSTPDYTTNALKALGVKTIWIVGDTGVVSQAQEDALKAAGYTTVRLGGNDRFATDYKVVTKKGADAVGTVNGKKTAFVANGLRFPDALAAGTGSFAKHLPVILTRQDSLPGDSLKALQDLGIQQVVIAGGLNAVNQDVEDAIKAAGIDVIYRADGLNRAETSVKIANWEIANLQFSKTGISVASGAEELGGADALTGAAHAGSLMYPLLVTFSLDKAGPSVVNFAKSEANTLAKGYIYGDDGAVPNSVSSEIAAAAKSVTSNGSYSVTPAGAQQKEVSSSSSTNEGAITLTFSGISAPVKVSTLPTGDVTTAANGSVTFADTDGNDVADDLGSTDTNNAVIESVNGAAYSASSTYSPVNGSVTVVIDSTSYDAGRVVVWKDADNGGDLDLKADNTPSEEFGVSDVLRWIPAEASNGNWGGGSVQYVDKANNFFVAGDETFKYDANDTPYYDDNYRITTDQFEQALSVGDDVDMYTGAYTRDASLPNTFDLYNDLPGTPENVKSTVGDFDTNASDTGANDVKVSWDAPSPTDALIDHYNVYETNSTGGSPVLVDQTDDATTHSVVAEDASTGDHYYVVRAVSQTGTVGDASDTTKATVSAPPAPATHAGAPLSNAAVYQDSNSNGTVDTGDILRVTFDETMSAPAVDASMTLTDQNVDANSAAAPTVGKVTNGLNSTWTLAADGKTYVITLTGAPVISTNGAQPGVQYPAVVTAATGVQDTAASNSPAEAQDWNVSGSSDHTF